MNYRGYASRNGKPPRRWFRMRRSISLQAPISEHANPYRIATGGRISLRHKISGTLFIIVLAVWGKVLLTNPYFSIRTIDIQGTSTIDKKALHNSIETALNRTRFRFLSERNFFIQNTERLQKVIASQFPVEEVTVTKTFPNILAIAVKERLAFVIYDNGATYTLVDEQGVAQKTLRKVAIHEQQIVTVGTEEGSSTSTRHYPDVPALHAAFGEYPVVYDQKRENNSEYTLNPDAVRGAIAAYLFLKDRTDFATHHFIYPNDYQTLLAENTYGATLALNPFTELSAQLETFLHAWQNELRKEKKNRVHINARYSGRVYVEEGTAEAAQ